MRLPGETRIVRMVSLFPSNDRSIIDPNQRRPFELLTFKRYLGIRLMHHPRLAIVNMNMNSVLSYPLP